MMRIVLDLQACQIQHSNPAIADHALAFGQALARHAGAHAVHILLSDQYPATIMPLRLAFGDLLAPENITVFSVAGPTREADPGNAWRSEAAALLRENALANLAPDLVHVAQFFTGWDDDGVSSIGPHDAQFATCVSLHEMLAPAQAFDDLPDTAMRDWHYRKMQALKNAALVLTYSESARLNTIHALQLPAQQVCDMSTGPQLDWDAIARTALDAFGQIVQSRQAAQKLALPAAAFARPRLAFVSPLPPAQTGIAGYSAMLLPELARYYEIEVVTDQAQIAAPWLTANFPLRSVAWFDEHAKSFDRIIYHIGNSNFHVDMFDLLERHAGVVVLHDFFLTGALANIAYNLRRPHTFKRALYAAHGYQALFDFKQQGEQAVIWKYPCNKTILEQASGVIVHSQFQRRLAEQWYGAGAADDWRTIPLLRETPSALERKTARGRLGLNDDAFVVCAYGMLGPTKHNDLLIKAWLASEMAADPRCQLVFVGENDPNDYGASITRQIAASGCGQRIRITGFTSDILFESWLVAADLAVQLRARTRGETSASILDCLANGLPTIVNANGAAAELPDALLIKLPDALTQHDLSTALNRVWQEPELRQDLARRAVDFVQTRHHPALAGALYRDAIEHFARHGRQAHYQRLVQSLDRLTTGVAPDVRDLAQSAAGISANQALRRPRQLLIDITPLTLFDLKTGIQRVVRSVLNILLNNPPPGMRVEPVYDAGGHYVYARKFVADMIGLDIDPSLGLENSPVQYHAGDTFLGLDLYMSGTVQNQAWLMTMRRHGVKIYFVVFDMLPVLRPEVFPPNTEADFQRWLECICAVSDGLVCISRAVADELAHWIETVRPVRHGATKIGYFHLGADIGTSLPSYGLSANASAALAQIRARPSMLMVGTVEPRKGHTQALDACEILWAKGIEVNLVIVGKAGWMVEPLIARLRKHPQRDNFLFWLEHISDEHLLQLYAQSSVLLAASEGEGFGLPLIEAAQHKLPIIARGLPVFREVAGEHAYFFDADTPDELAHALQAWLLLHAAGKAPASTGMPWLTWSESTAALMDAVERQQWYRIAQ